MDTKGRREVDGVELWSGCWTYTSELGGEAGVVREEPGENRPDLTSRGFFLGPFWVLFRWDEEVFV